MVLHTSGANRYFFLVGQLFEASLERLTVIRTSKIVNCSLFPLSDTLILHHVCGSLLGGLNCKFWPYWKK